MLRKTKYKLTFGIFIMILLLLNVGHLFSDERTRNLQSIVLDDFELNSEGKPNRYWAAIPIRFGKKDNLESGESLQKLSWVESWPESYFGRDGILDIGGEKKEYKHCLALQIAFNRQGYNYVELYPLTEKEGKYTRTPIPFNGIVQQIDLWVWGANYNYSIEMVLMDFRGVEYRLPIGKIKHVGWKNFTVTIPNYIPQKGEYLLGEYQFSLVKLVVWTEPSEKVSGTYVYLDHIKYLSDIFEAKFDGLELSNKETVNNLWEKAPKAPEEKDLGK